tara:strand:+ start:538 stop:822 length:285 start_codon:yes stop_codon:yes gene_type:complete
VGVFMISYDSNNSKPNDIRTNHALRTFDYQQGNIVNLIYSMHPSQELVEFKKARFVKCFVRDGIDRVQFEHDGIVFVLPLDNVGIVGVEYERLR